MTIITRNNVKVTGRGKQAILFAPGFGCDQSVWEKVSKSFEESFQVILFDYVGMGDSDVTAYDKEKYSSLFGYAQDVLDICSSLHLKDVIFIGHSVSSIIGMLASIQRPDYFSHLIMVGPSPCYLNDPPQYYGGFEKEDLVGLLELMEKNFIGWANFFASTITNNSDRPDVEKELADRFCSTDPIIAHQFAEACFFSDNRHDLPKVTVPSLILQCSNDIIAPTQVGAYMHQHLPYSTLKHMEATGHCPHLSHPEETTQAIYNYLMTNSVTIHTGNTGGE